MTKKHPKYRPAFTLVEMILAVGIVSVIGLAVTGMVYASYQNWEFTSRRSNVLQDGQAAMEQMIRILRQAKGFSAVTESTDEAGYLTFTSVDNIIEEFRLNTTTSELEYGQPGALSALAGPVNKLVFTSYDTNENVLTGAVQLSSIQAVNIEATFVNAEDSSVSITLSGRVFIPTDLENSCLIGWWKLDETSGLTAADSSGNGNDGDLLNMIGNEWTTGALGGGLDLDGLNDSVEVSDDPGFDIANEITVTAWINPGDARARRTIVSKFARSGRRWRKDLYWFLNRDKIGGCLAGPCGARGTDWKPNVPIATNTWTHVALTYDGSAMVMYKDGVGVATNSVSGNLMLGEPSSNGSFYIGKNMRRGQYFEGVLDGVRIYSCALSPYEIAELANILRYREFTEAKASFDTTSITISTPAGTQENDLLIAAVATDGDTSSLLAPPGGEGWTQIDITAYSSNVTLGTWWKNAGASESPSHQFTWSGSQQAYSWMMRFTGHDTSDPIDDLAGGGGSSSTPTSPAVTTTVSDSLILRLGAFDDADITVDSPGLSGHAAITMDSSGGGSSGVGILGSWTSGLSHTVEAGSNRLLIFTAHVEDNDADMSLNSVTYGGQSMTKVIERETQEGSNRAYVVAYILDEAGIAAASGDTFSPSWSSTPDRVGYSSVFLSSVKQSNPTGTSASSGSNSSSTISTSALSTNNGDMVIVAGTAGNKGRYSVRNGFTEAIELSITSADGVAGYKQATGANETPNIRHNRPRRQVIIGFVVQDGSIISTGMVSGGAGYVRQSSSGDSGTSTFSLTGSEESRTLTIAISPAP